MPITDVHEVTVRLRLTLAEHQVAHCAVVLRTFMEQPVSLSALLPVMDLAAELNPDVAETWALNANRTVRLMGEARS